MTTIKEVAARAGVSPSTVSNVFLGKVPVREKTKQRVLNAARRLGYQPDGLAQALRRGRTRTLGLCVPFVTNPTIAAIVNGASRAARQAGYAITVCTIENRPKLQDIHLEILRRERAAAVITQPASNDPGPYQALRQAGTALVFVDCRPADLPADFLTPDYRTATRDAVRHLLDSGRRRVALITGPRWIDSTRERVAGYEAAHTAAGVPVDEDLLLTSERRQGRTRQTALAEVLRRPADTRPDALVAGSADVTLDALACLLDLGIAMPEAVALVGTGDLAFARLASPPLSMIEVDGEALGRRAVELALERIQETDEGREDAGRELAPFRDVVLPTRLTIRASS